MAAYIVTLAAALRYVGEGDVTGPAAYLLALLPGLSIAAVFWAIGRLMVEEKDEYLRLLLVRQSLVATGFTLGIVTMWGFLENFELVPHVDAFYVCCPLVPGPRRRELRQLADAAQSWGQAMNNRLKALRAERKLEPGRPCGRLEVSRQSVNAIETGRYDPSLPLAFRIAEIFGLPIEVIFLKD
jgi:DNA-binding XRE family transcriptional regulator